AMSYLLSSPSSSIPATTDSALYTEAVIRRSALWALAAGLRALAASCGGGADVSVASHVIAFSSDRALPPRSEAADFDTRRLDLYLMNADGSHLERLTSPGLTDGFATVA